MRLLRTLPLVLVSLLLAACAGTIPDLKPYSAVTAKLGAATNEVLDAAAASVDDRRSMAIAALRAATESKSPGAADLAAKRQRTVDALDANAATLATSIDARKKALRALVAYSERLASIADSVASNQRKADQATAAVKSLADSLKTFAETPYTDAGAAAARTVADLVGAVVKQIQLQKAGATLAESLEKAEQPVATLAELLARDLDELGPVFEDAPGEVALHAKERFRDEFGDAVKTLTTQRAGAVAALKHAEQIEMALFKAIKEQDKLAAELRHLTGGPAIDAAAARADAGVAAIVATRRALAEWGDAHKKIAEAVREGREPSLVALAETVAELAKRTDELRDAGKAMRKVNRSATN